MRMMHGFIFQPRFALEGFSARQHKTNYLYTQRKWKNRGNGRSAETLSMHRPFKKQVNLQGALVYRYHTHTQSQRCHNINEKAHVLYIYGAIWKWKQKQRCYLISSVQFVHHMDSRTPDHVWQTNRQSGIISSRQGGLHKLGRYLEVKTWTAGDYFAGQMALLA